MTTVKFKTACPIMDTKGVIGSLSAHQEEYLDTTSTVHAYASAPKQCGATIIEHNPALDLNQRTNRTWNMVPEKGAIHAEHVANAGRLWVEQVGRVVGLELPVTSLAHQYLITEGVPLPSLTQLYARNID